LVQTLTNKAKCAGHTYATKTILYIFTYMDNHNNAVSHIYHIYWSMLHCLNMVEILDVNNSDQDTGIATLILFEGLTIINQPRVFLISITMEDAEKIML